MGKKFLLLFILFCLVSLNQMRLEKPKITISKQDSSLNFDQKYLKIFNLGFSNMISSWLWVTTLLESDIEPYQKKDLNSWIFLRFITIISLDPKFYEVYLFGGKYLSIIKDDVHGAEIIFNKGLEIYPDDFWLIINAAHNYFFEMGLPDKAYPLYKKAQDHPEARKNFKILPSIVAKLEKNRGDHQAAFDLLSIAKENQTSEYFKKYYEKSLYALKAEIDLDCLNKGGLKCSHRDFLGFPYVQSSSGAFQARLAWKKFEFSAKTIERIEKNRGTN